MLLYTLGHIMTKVGHTTEFWDNFKFLLENASKIKDISVNYKEKPISYCGMEINENPLLIKLCPV